MSLSVCSELELREVVCAWDTYITSPRLLHQEPIARAESLLQVFRELRDYALRVQEHRDTSPWFDHKISALMAETARLAAEECTTSELLSISANLTDELGHLWIYRVAMHKMHAIVNRSTYGWFFSIYREKKWLGDLVGTLHLLPLPCLDQLLDRIVDCFRGSYGKRYTQVVMEQARITVLLSQTRSQVYSSFEMGNGESWDDLGIFPWQWAMMDKEVVELAEMFKYPVVSLESETEGAFNEKAIYEVLQRMPPERWRKNPLLYVKLLALIRSGIPSEADRYIESWNAGWEAEMREQVLDTRNARWVEQLLPLLQKSEGPLCIVVGENHLFGEHGLIHLLEQQGFSIDQM